MNRRFGTVVLLSLLSTVAVSFFFIVFPEIDVYWSSLFYDQHRFFLRNNPIVEIAAKYNYLFAVVYLLLTIAITWLSKEARYRTLIFLCTSLLVGPGIIVNLLLKGYWGRSRPLSVETFGGNEAFSPAWVITGLDVPNGSFVSGHASAVFAFFAFALLYRGNRALFFWLGTAVAGLLAGLGRTVEGKHFLSDVIISGHLVWLVALISYYFIFIRTDVRQH